MLATETNLYDVLNHLISMSTIVALWWIIYKRR